MIGQIGRTARACGRLVAIGVVVLTLGLAAKPAPAGAELYTVDEVVAYVVPYLDQYWASAASSWGIGYYSPSVYYYNTWDRPGPVMSGCGELGINNAYYCWYDSSIYLDYAYLDQQIQWYGDFAVAAVVAHEWGHHMEHVYGWSIESLYSIQIELYADCTAGAVAAALYWEGVLEAGDLEEAYQLALVIGDPVGTDPSIPGAHGTPDQRIASFMGGYFLGDSYDCDMVVDTVLSA
jgi:predicted metalloprotease